MTDFPRLRWLFLLQIVAIAGASLDAGSVAEALQSAGVVMSGILSLVLFTFRIAQAFQDIDTDDFVHTMDGRVVKRPAGLWERVW